jgi:hypothetical protein
MEAERINIVDFSEVERANDVVKQLSLLTARNIVFFGDSVYISSSKITKGMIHVIIDEIAKVTNTKVRLVRENELTMSIRNDNTVFLEILGLKGDRFGEHYKYHFYKNFDEKQLRKAVDNLVFLVLKGGVL